jgi:hypothetical protein
MYVYEYIYAHAAEDHQRTTGQENKRVHQNPCTQPVARPTVPHRPSEAVLDSPMALRGGTTSEGAHPAIFEKVPLIEKDHQEATMWLPSGKRHISNFPIQTS